jgi:hypothetical protein
MTRTTGSRHAVIAARGRILPIAAANPEQVLLQENPWFSAEVVFVFTLP